MPNRLAWGVQFHPEFSADVSRAYIEAKRNDIVAEGLDADRLLAEVRDTPVGTEILARFARLAASAIGSSPGTFLKAATSAAPAPPDKRDREALADRR